MKIGYIGLGKMGARMVEKLLQEGHHVVVWNRSEDPVTALVARTKNTSQLSVARSLPELVQLLTSTRIIWSMLPAGDATQSILDEIISLVSSGDIVIDGGNAHYKDTERRYGLFKSRGIRYLGIGVSGGILAMENGYPLMIGGEKSAYDEILPVLQSLAKPHGGFIYVGEGGAGHFVKMVHNGIEYGMMQSLGEGFGVLEKSPYRLNLLDIVGLWQKGTIISGFLLDRTRNALGKNPTLADIDGIIAESGEAAWTIDAGNEENVPVSVIEDSLKFRRQSQKDAHIQQSFAAKLIAALRHEFGGHAIEKKKA